ncbi:hypothetical protein HZB78_03275 [Candidatus Collierbacteria bacterium]|nr:hypothetical protein [Candidatus Collierbacteria bacterium]
MSVEEAIQQGEPWAIERFFPPEELRQLEYWGIFPEGDARLQSYFDPEKTIVGSSGVLTEAEEPNGQPLIDGIDPLALSPESPLYELSTFPPVRRMFSVGRLGLSREAPFLNISSRGQHEFQVGAEGLKFAIKNSWPRRDQLLTFIAGQTHDPHPGFGDAAKATFGISEVDAMRGYFSDEHSSWWNSWLKIVDDKFGIKLNYQEIKELIESVINRRENGLSGVITHGSSKDRLDLDFWTYTVEDARTAIQSVRMPDARYDPETHPLVQVARPPFAERMTQLRAGLLGFDNLEDLGRMKKSVWIYFQEVDIRPHLKIVDGQLIVTNPTIFRNLAQLAAVLYEGHYFHPNTLGPEFMFAKEINADRASYPSIEEFTTLTDSQLAEKLKGTPAGKWLKGGNHHGWRIVSSDESHYPQPDKIAVEATYPKVNLRLSTPVMYRGDIRPYKELFPKEAEPLVALERRSGQEMILVKDDPVHPLDNLYIMY